MNDISPSEWFTNHFGSQSVAVMQVLAEAGRATHERGLEAKQGSGLRSNDAYGTVWLILPEELCSRLTPVLPNLDFLRPHGSRYELPIYASKVILPVRVSDVSNGPNDLRLRVSNMRKRIFELETRSPDEPLDFGEDYRFEDKEDEQMLNDLEAADGIILAAYELSARSGLQHIWIGEAVLGEDGHVTWLYCEELPINSLTGPTTLTLVNDAAPRFDAGPIPESPLTLRVNEESLEEEEQEPESTSDADSDVEGTDAG